MLQRNRLQVSGVFVAVPLLALAALAVLTWNQSGSTVLFPRWAGDESGVPVEQVGEDTFENPLSTESSADVAAKIQQVLKKEAVLLRKISKRAEKKEKVHILIKAGQIGKEGPKGPQGYRGAQGFEGPQGLTGPPGPQGPRGIQGVRGFPGIKGGDGVSGPDGPTGDNGPAGPPGPRGRRGREGKRGPEGPLGPNGKNGSPGTYGPSGTRGRSVYVGIPGEPGPRGLQGIQGVNGLDGETGDRGATGPPGADGRIGPLGPPGPPGNDGKNVCGNFNTMGQDMCCGVVPAKEWVLKSDYSAEASLDLSSCNFVGSPMIFSSVISNSHGQYSMNTEGNVISNDEEVDPVKPKVIIRTEIKMDPGNIAGMRGPWDWKVQWCAYGTIRPDRKNAAKKLYDVCAGSSNSAWAARPNVYGPGQSDIYLDVSTAGCGWTDGAAPMIFTSLSDSACGSELFKQTPRCAARSIGWQSTFSTTVKGFRVYAKGIPGGNLPTAEEAKKYNWQVKWVAVRPSKGVEHPVGGFPCTASRLLKGNGDQDVFTDFGAACCDTSTTSGWKEAGSDSITKTIDISQCKFEKISYLFTGLVGGGPVDNLVGAPAYSTTSDANKFTIYLYSGGKYKFYNAAQYDWKIQWCAYGR